MATETLDRKNLLTTKQVAALLNVEPMTVYSLRRRGDLRAIRIGHAVRFDPEEVEEYLNRSREVAREKIAA